MSVRKIVTKKEDVGQLNFRTEYVFCSLPLTLELVSAILERAPNLRKLELSSGGEELLPTVSAALHRTKVRLVESGKTRKPPIIRLRRKTLDQKRKILEDLSADEIKKLNHLAKKGCRWIRIIRCYLGVHGERRCSSEELKQEYGISVMSSLTWRIEGLLRYLKPGLSVNWCAQKFAKDLAKRYDGKIDARPRQVLAALRGCSPMLLSGISWPRLHLKSLLPTLELLLKAKKSGRLAKLAEARPEYYRALELRYGFAKDRPPGFLTGTKLATTLKLSAHMVYARLKEALRLLSEAGEIKPRPEPIPANLAFSKDKELIAQYLAVKRVVEAQWAYEGRKLMRWSSWSRTVAVYLLAVEFRWSENQLRYYFSLRKRESIYYSLERVREVLRGSPGSTVRADFLIRFEAARKNLPLELTRKNP